MYQLQILEIIFHFWHLIIYIYKYSPQLKMTTVYDMHVSKVTMHQLF